MSDGKIYIYSAFKKVSFYKNKQKYKLKINFKKACKKKKKKKKHAYLGFIKKNMAKYN